MMLALVSPFLIATEPTQVKFSSWHIYWDNDKVEPSDQLYGGALDQIGAFAVDFSTNGNLMSAFPSLPDTTMLIRKNNPHEKVLLTAVNDVVGGKKNKLKDPKIIHEIISSPSRVEEHIRRLSELAAPFDGIEIDYENLDRADREAFSQFIERLAKKIHAEGKILSVVVEPKTREVLWNGAGAMDWSEIGRSADTVKVMAYYLHSPGGIPGPVAPMKWVEEVTAFGLTQLPREKLTVVLVMNGVDWSDKKKGATIHFDAAMEIAQRKKEKIKWDKVSQSPYFRYKDGNEQHLVWFENDASLEAKLESLTRAGIAHVGLWRLGEGDPLFWRRILDRSKSMPK